MNQREEPMTTMTTMTTGQMTWKISGATDSALHLRHHAHETWQPYQNFPDYILPDPPGFSSGYATFLALLKENWQLL
jgi:hypothetical protein